jgi:hypothetical protein
MKTGFWKQIAIVVLLVGIAAAASGFGSCSGYSSLNPAFGSVILTPSSLTIMCTPAPFTASQAYYTGSFNAVSADPNTVTVAATSPPNTFQASKVGTTTGSTTITVTGGASVQGVLNVTSAGCAPCVRHRDMWDTCPLRKHAR